LKLLISWIDFIKQNVTYNFLLLLEYHTTRWKTAKLCFKISVQDFVHAWKFKYFAFKIATSDFWKTKCIQFVNPASYSDLEDGVNE
jgi:hypothetical protein